MAPKDAVPAAAASKPGQGELGRRIVSSLVLAPLAIGAAYLGGFWFLLFWTLAGIGVLWEWVGLVATGERQATIVMGVASLLGAAIAAMSGHADLAAAVVVLGALAVACFAPSGQHGWSAAGVIYAGAIVLAPLVLHNGADLGFAAILVVFAVVWATDIFAYFVGRALGGPRLWPAVSPKKTWSGALAGSLAAIAAGVSVAALAGVAPTSALVLVCLALSIISQAGDLFESAMKRRFGAKDSSHLIPGHGGLMDRLDGFVAAAFVATLIGLARGGVEAPARGLLVW